MPENQSTTSISYDPLKGHESTRERLMSRGRLPPCECLWKWSELRISYKLRQILDKGFLSAQLVKRCTGIAEVMGSNPVQAWIFFFRPYFHHCLSTVHYCEGHFHIHAFIRSSNIWPSYIHSRLYIWSSQTSTYIYIPYTSLYLSIYYLSI